MNRVTVERNLLSMKEKLIALKQEHLFADWDAEGISEEEKASFFQRWLDFEKSYPGGINGYMSKACSLLDGRDCSKEFFDGCSIQQPDCVDMSKFDDYYRQMETLGLEAVHETAFVLVAGGLGERLGYTDIKMTIPVELTSEMSYMKLYCCAIKAYEDRLNTSCIDTEIQVPFLIMTSGGTHNRMVEYLKENDYFGLKKDQVTIIEQSLVPAVIDAAARFAKKSPYEILLKPNGHGDIHKILHDSGLAENFYDSGLTRILFLQDTNAQIANLFLPLLGVSVDKDLDFNFTAVPRVAGEAIGAVVSLEIGGDRKTVNVEYNFLNSLLEEGDVQDDSGYSPYPGNINLLTVKLEPYLKVLRETKGLVAEFINPKYSKDGKTFTSPARVESMMQDLTRQLDADAKIGVTLFNRDWALAPVKNSLELSTEKLLQDLPADSASSAESAFYDSCRLKLKMAAVDIEDGELVEFSGIPFNDGARVVLMPSYSINLSDIKEKINGLCLSKHSSLVLDGDQIYLENVRLEGESALIVKVCDGAKVVIESLKLTTPGYILDKLNDEDDGDVPEGIKIRGYKREVKEPLIIEISEPGDYIVGTDGVCRKVGI